MNRSVKNGIKARVDDARLVKDSNGNWELWISATVNPHVNGGRKRGACVKVS